MPYVSTKEEDKLFQAYQGRQPANVDMNRWPEEKFLALISFLKIFVNSEDYSKWIVNKAVLEDVYTKYAETTENIYYREFLVRLQKEYKVMPVAMVFRNKVSMMARLFVLYCRRNPAIVTPAIREAVLGYKYLEGGLSTFSEEKTQSGSTIITQNVDNMSVQPVSPELVYHQALNKVIHIYRDVAESITRNDIKKMSPKEKIDALGKLGPILTSVRNNKAKSQIFLNLNVGASNRQDLENKLQEYQEEQEKQ